MRLVAVLNLEAGGLRLTPDAIQATVAAGFQTAGASVLVQTVAGAALPSALAAALAEPADALVVGGGDGTVATAARLLIAGGDSRPLGILPLGTINRLAHALGVPGDLDGAIACILQGRVRRIDVGEVNGRVFLNNSVLGLFPSLARVRERERFGTWWQLARAFTRVVIKAVRYHNLISIDLAGPDGTRRIVTPALAVASNPYHGDRGGFPADGRRLDEGRLGIYVARHRTALQMAILLVDMALNRWQLAPRVEAFTATGVTVSSRRKRLSVANDGEVVRLAPPLHYRVLPGALSVLAPPPWHPGSGPPT